MKLVHFEQNPDSDTHLKVGVSSVEDLWHLHNLVFVGDRVRTKTVRKVVKETATGSGTSEKRTMTLEILIQAIEFDPRGELRWSGINKSQNDFVKMNAHHTITVQGGAEAPLQTISVFKDSWDSVAEERLKEACNQEAKADTVAVVMDYGMATVNLVTPTLMVTRARIETHIPKKHRLGSSRDESIGKFFGQVLEAMLNNTDFEHVKVVLLCSPGTVREEFQNFAIQRATQSDGPGPLRTLLLNKSKLMQVKVSSGHKSAIHEALADRVVMNQMEQTKCAEDVRTWQAFHDMMNNDESRCCYTAQYVYEASKSLSIDQLLILDEMLRVPDVVKRRFFTYLCEGVKESGGRVSVYSSQHVTGEQLNELGGIAAILRHPMPELEELEVDPNFFENLDVSEMLRTRSSGSATSE